MPIRRSSLILAILGTLLIALAVVLRFVLVPLAVRLPGGVDLTVRYQGSGTLMDSAAFQAGRPEQALRPNQAISVDRRVRVLSTHGNTAVLRDDLALRASGQALTTDSTYALDRRTWKSVPPPAGTVVEPTAGALTSGFPIHPKANDSYRYYDPASRTVTTMTFTGTDRRAGRSVNVYRIAPSGPLRNPDMLAALPSAVPKSLVAGLAPALPADVVSAFTPETFAALPDPIPLSYTTKASLVAYVDQQTGIALDETVSQQVIVNVTAGGRTVALLPVVDVAFRMTPASAADLADKARTAGTLMFLGGLVAPAVLGLIGLILIVVAVVRRRPPVATHPSRIVAGPRQRDRMTTA